MKTPVAPRGSPQFNLRLPDDLRTRIEEEAKRSGRSMNTEIVTRLAASLEADQDEATVKSGRDAVEAKLDRILELLEKK